MTDIYYCDDYEAITGRTRDGSIGPAQTKAVTPDAADVEVASVAPEPTPNLVESEAPADPTQPIV